MKKTITLLSLLLCLSFSNTTHAQIDPLVGQISMFAGNYAPRGWALCDGQLLPISQYSTLFSVLGTAYGGDGVTTFALPDLRGRVPMHAGNGPGLTNRRLGEKFGTETNTLNVSQMPSHSHSVNAVADDGNQSVPTGNLPAGTKVLDKEYSNATANTTMSSGMIGSQGQNQPVNNVQPVQVINYIIALQGIYPSRN
ncbi:phage tail protein [Gelatiniphilus marinus]|uniref:Phage tail protein n=1 Tax=Gelatiniphilus marinus TaxID=1759464 RepID=A0ABW5JXQ4_9FLAO